MHGLSSKESQLPRRASGAHTHAHASALTRTYASILARTCSFTLSRTCAHAYAHARTSRRDMHAERGE
eukprot:2527309-Pleurochrysis_carterae.AAC.2